VWFFAVKLSNDLGGDDGEKREREEAVFILEAPYLISERHTEEVQTLYH